MGSLGSKTFQLTPAALPQAQSKEAMRRPDFPEGGELLGWVPRGSWACHSLGRGLPARCYCLHHTLLPMATL